MATAKRLYLYSVSAVGLGLVIYALTILGGLLLDQLGLRTTYPYLAPATSQTNREALSLAIGLVVVGLPLWLFHWSLTERMVGGATPAAAAERQSIVRAFYFGVLLFLAAAFTASSAADVIREAIIRPLNASNGFYPANLSGAVAGLVIWFGVLMYHVWVRTRDLRQGPTIKNAAAWTSRIFLYWPATGALAAALLAGGTIVTTILQAATGYGDRSVVPAGSYYPISGPLATSTAAWWVYPLAGGVAMFAAYGLLWLGLWRYAHNLASRMDEQGADERHSRVRLAYFVIVVASLASYVLLYVGEAVSNVLEFVLGVRVSYPNQPLWVDTAVLVMTALPFAFGWWWHRRRGAWEWTHLSGSWLRAVRPMDYFTALVGLVAFAGALIEFAALMGQKLTSNLGYMSVDAWKLSTAAPIAIMAVSAPIWLWPWMASQRRLSFDRSGETHSTARKAFLFAVGGVAIISAAGSLAFIAYRATRVAVGLDSSKFGTDVQMPVIVLVVAVVFLAYHAFWIRRDQLLGGAVEADVVAEGVAAPDRELVVSGPAGADLDALRASLADKLPEGFSIAVRTREGTA